METNDALTTVSIGKLTAENPVLASTFNEIKTAVQAEYTKRSTQFSRDGFGYLENGDPNNPKPTISAIANTIVKAKDFTDLLSVLEKINKDYPGVSSLIKEIKENAYIRELLLTTTNEEEVAAYVNSLLTHTPEYNTESTNDCNSTCMGLCYAGCYSLCTGCTNTCGQSCATNCTSTCSTECGNDCKNDCGGVCSDTCGLSCTTTCTTTCSNNCGNQCTGCTSCSGQ